MGMGRPGQKKIPAQAPTPPPPPSVEVALGQQAEPLLVPSDGGPSGSHQGPAVVVPPEGLEKKERRTTLTNATTLHLEKATEYMTAWKPCRRHDHKAAINGVETLQLFVNVCQKKLSMQENFNTTTIRELIVSACHKAGVKSSDFYATYDGKCLNPDKAIAYYPIFKDSTIHLISRLRAGRDYKSVTFEKFMSKNMGRRYCQVNLSALSENQKTKKSTVTFLSEFSANWIHKIMIYICGKHREGSSFDGKFSASDILIINKTMVDIDISNLQDYDFIEETCSNDYAKLCEIFTAYFTGDGKPTALYFENFLDYLFCCPAKEKSNSEPVIRFVTNHPALASYMDRIKQCILLDNMVHRLDINDLGDLATACSKFPSWLNDVEDVPALKTVYYYNSKFDPIKNKRIVNPEYDTHILGCLHFARNYFSHADYQMKLLEVEAGFAATLEKFLPTILLEVAMDFKAPADFDILTLLGNPLADSFEPLHISDHTEDP